MANEPIIIEYNRELAALEATLEEVDRPGNYYVFGRFDTPLPRIEIEGVGVLSFPLPAAQAEAIARNAERAPYGRGEDTLVDTSVRKVWQIVPEKIRLGGKAWPRILDTLLAELTTGLGCTGRKISAELYKFLLYDEGGFFISHRDTEKTAGMFGTLVITLPAEHAGGELIVRHAGHEARFQPDDLDVSELAYAAFYADCEHEVRPLLTGYRPCLVFNLIQQPVGKKGTIGPLTAPDYGVEIDAAATILRNTFAAPEAPAKLVWLLEHQYSPEALGFANLKRADAAIGKVLTAAAERADCVAHLTLVHIEESGAAEPLYFSPRRSRRRWYDDDEEDEAVDEEFEIVEAFDSLQYLDHWLDTGDRPKAFGQIPLAEGELLPDGALDDEPPDEQRMTEATGNEGASYERSYLRAAITLWPRARFAEVLLQCGAVATLPYFAEQLADRDRDAQARTRLIELAHKIIDAWPAHPRSHYYRHAEDTPSPRSEMLHLLVDLGDVESLRRFIDEVIEQQFDGSENQTLAKALPLLPTDVAGDCFSKIVHQHAATRLAECIDLFLVLVGAADTTSRAILPPLAEACVQGLAAKPERDAGWSIYTGYSQRTVAASQLADLLDALAGLSRDDLRLNAVTHLSADHQRYDPVALLTPMIALLRERHGTTVEHDPAFLQLWRETADFLLQRSETPPPTPTDWKQEVKIKPTGEDWKELQDFACDPTARVHRFPVRKERRQVLHQLITSHDLDMTHVTERRGRPHTLVCTKMRRHYRNRCREYIGDVDAMSRLSASLAEPADDAVGMHQRLMAAQEARRNWNPPDNYGE